MINDLGTELGSGAREGHYFYFLWRTAWANELPPSTRSYLVSKNDRGCFN